MARFATVGEEFTGELHLDRDEVVRFAAAAGDRNPLHHDEPHARATRFGGLIASGTQVVAAFMGLSASHFSARGAALGLEFAFKLKKAARVGDTLAMRWRVTRVDPKPRLAGEIVHLEGEVRDGAGDLAVTATATLLVSDRL